MSKDWGTDEWATEAMRLKHELAYWKRRALAAEGVIAAVARNVPYLPPLNMREDRTPEQLHEDGDCCCDPECGESCVVCK